MDIQLEMWLRTDTHATSRVIAPVGREPKAWTDEDVQIVLTEMLRALEQAKNPSVPVDRPIALRGFSWIVSPYADGGVVIAIELSLGAVVAGPFDVAERTLSDRIERVIAGHRLPRPAAATETVH